MWTSAGLLRANRSVTIRLARIHVLVTLAINYRMALGVSVSIVECFLNSNIVSNVQLHGITVTNADTLLCVQTWTNASSHLANRCAVTCSARIGVLVTAAISWCKAHCVLVCKRFKMQYYLRRELVFVFVVVCLFVC
jgi:hypothetical protein